MNFFKLEDLKYLKILNSMKTLTIIFLIGLVTYLMVNKPKFEAQTKIQFDIDSLTIEKDTI